MAKQMIIILLDDSLRILSLMRLQILTVIIHPAMNRCLELVSVLGLLNP